MLRPQAVAVTGQRIFVFFNVRYLFSSPWSQGGHFLSGKYRRKKQTGLPSGESAENGWTKAASGSEAGNPFRRDAAIRGRSIRYLVLLRAETGILSGRCFGKRLTDTLSVQVVAEPVMQAVSVNSRRRRLRARCPDRGQTCYGRAGAGRTGRGCRFGRSGWRRCLSPFREGRAAEPLFSIYWKYPCERFFHDGLPPVARRRTIGSGRRAGVFRVCPESGPIKNRTGCLLEKTRKTGKESGKSARE